MKGEIPSMADMATRMSKPLEGERKKPLLILVDSDAAQLYYTGILLQRLDYTIYTTKTAEEALEIMNITVPGVIVTEATLSGVSGLDFIKQVKRNPATSSIPVLLLTASAGPLIRENYLLEGCADILVKPVDPDALYAAIQKVTEVTPRTYVRLKICLDVLVGEDTVAAGTRSGDCVTALSENGMYVSTQNPGKAGTKLPFIIFLGTVRIDVQGIVLYSFDRGKGPLRTSGMGIKFLHISPDDQAMIQSFIKKALTADMSRGK
jgi:CheY-like chemotaxis protein